MTAPLLPAIPARAQCVRQSVRGTADGALACFLYGCSGGVWQQRLSPSFPVSRWMILCLDLPSCSLPILYTTPSPLAFNHSLPLCKAVCNRILLFAAIPYAAEYLTAPVWCGEAWKRARLEWCSDQALPGSAEQQLSSIHNILIPKTGSVHQYLGMCFHSFHFNYVSVSYRSCSSYV